MNARHQKVIATLTMAFAFSAVVIGSAQAAGRPDNRAGIRGIGSQNTEMSDVFTRAVARAGIASQNADMSDVFTRAVARAHAAPTVRPDDRAGIRGAGPELVATAPPVTTTSASFHWTDAGVGAAATLALILVLAGLALARSSHQRNHAILD